VKHILTPRSQVSQLFVVSGSGLHLCIAHTLKSILERISAVKHLNLSSISRLGNNKTTSFTWLHSPRFYCLLNTIRTCLGLSSFVSLLRTDANKSAPQGIF